MKAKIGTLLMAIGYLMVAAAAVLFVLNNIEQQNAAKSTDELMPKLIKEINDGQKNIVNPAEKSEMTVKKIDGFEYIGFVGIPKLGLELPVMADWSEYRLKIAPCRYSGDLYDDDLVIMAHNYKVHFKNLDRLQAGDTVTFTDMNAVTTEYKVAALDMLHETDIEQMTAVEYDLTLFTCSYSGSSRVTVRCDRKAKV